MPETPIQKKFNGTGGVGGFPNPLDTREEKANPEWGYRYISAAWQHHTQNITLFNTRRANDIVNRKYREGLQSVQNTKNRLDINGDQSYVNLDFSPINRIASIVDNIVGKLMNMPIKIQCNPVNPEAQSKVDEYRKKMWANMYIKENAADLEQVTGIPTMPQGQYVPESEDEAKLHLANFRLDESIAMELALLWVSKENKSEESRAKIIEDLVTIKRAAIYRYYDENFNIIEERVDPVDLVTPYSKYDDFRNATYQGIIKQYQIWELAEMNPLFTDEDLWHIAMESAGKNANPLWNYGQSYENYYNSNTGIRPYFNFNISVLDFYFITQNTDVRVKKQNSKGGFFFEKKNSMYRGENTDQKEVITKRSAFLYGGKWVIGTKYVWDYGMVKNQPREKYPDGSYSPKVRLPISVIAPGIYDMENKSIVERLRTFEDLWNLAHQKAQQTLIKIAPPGIKFDIRGLDGIILNGDKAATPLEVLKMYQQTGSFPFSSIDKDGNVINSSVIEPTMNSIGNILQEYIGVQQHYMQMMNDVIGFNSAVDASSPDANALVGVQKMAASATQNALRPLYTASCNLILESKKEVALMIQDCITHNYEAFKLSLGADYADVLKLGKDIPLCSFGLELEMLPDDDEKMYLGQLTQIGLQNGSLFPSDLIRINQLMKENVKGAAQLLVMLEKKNKKDADASQASIQEQQGQVQQQAIQAASQAKQQELQLEAQAKMQIMQAEFQLKSQLSMQEHQQTMQQIAGKNVGMESVANINAGKSVQVQSISTQGKLMEAHTSAGSKVEVEKIKHSNNLENTSISHESEILKGFQKHDHAKEQMSLQAELTPKPVAPKEK